MPYCKICGFYHRIPCPATWPPWKGRGIDGVINNEFLREEEETLMVGGRQIGKQRFKQEEMEGMHGKSLKDEFYDWLYPEDMDHIPMPVEFKNGSKIYFRGSDNMPPIRSVHKTYYGERAQNRRKRGIRALVAYIRLTNDVVEPRIREELLDLFYTTRGWMPIRTCGTRSGQSTRSNRNAPSGD